LWFDFQILRLCSDLYVDWEQPIESAHPCSSPLSARFPMIRLAEWRMRSHSV